MNRISSTVLAAALACGLVSAVPLPAQAARSDVSAATIVADPLAHANAPEAPSSPDPTVEPTTEPTVEPTPEPTVESTTEPTPPADGGDPSPNDPVSIFLREYRPISDDWYARAKDPSISEDEKRVVTHVAYRVGGLLSALISEYGSLPDAEQQAGVDATRQRIDALIAAGDAGIDPDTGMAPVGDEVVLVPSDVQPLPAEEREAFAREFVPTPDATGSYLSAAADLAAAFGVPTYLYKTSSYYECNRILSPRDIETFESAAAWYCLMGEIWIVEENLQGTSVAPVDTMRHELAHGQIFAACGTLDPPVSPSQEGVTNSYAVLFLGADPAKVSTGEARGYDYTMTPETDAAAQKIHDGICDESVVEPTPAPTDPGVEPTTPATEPAESVEPVPSPVSTPAGVAGQDAPTSSKPMELAATGTEGSGAVWGSVGILALLVGAVVVGVNRRRSAIDSEG